MLSKIHQVDLHQRVLVVPRVNLGKHRDIPQVIHTAILISKMIQLILIQNKYHMYNDISIP